MRDADGLSGPMKRALLNIMSGVGATPMGLRATQAGAHARVMQSLRAAGWLDAKDEPTKKARQWLDVDDYREVPLLPHLADLARPELVRGSK